MPDPVAGCVFISYRRQDASHLAGRLYDRLADRLGDDQVFIDVDTIAPGLDFAEVIAQAVCTCGVLLAVIGPRWLTVTDDDGRRRLDDPDDIVRLEITAALERNIRVIPILIEGAVMPRRQALPEGLAGLARRNALSLRHESFRADADRLLATVEPILRAPVTPTTPPHKTGQEVAGAGDFLAIIPTAPDDQQRFLQRLADWAVALGERRLARLTTYHGKAGITTLLPRVSDGAGLVTIWKDTRSSYLQFWRSVFERRAPRSLSAVEAATGEAGVRQGNVVYEVSDELLAALTAAYEEAATGQLAWSDDLQFAQQTGVAVDVRLFDGQHFQTGVAEVDDENGFVSLYRPQHFDDTTTRVRFRLDDITSLAVTDIRWGPTQ